MEKHTKTLKGVVVVELSTKDIRLQRALNERQLWWVSTFGQAVSPLRIVCSIVSTIFCPNSSEVGGGHLVIQEQLLKSCIEKSAGREQRTKL